MTDLAALQAELEAAEAAVAEEQSLRHRLESLRGLNATTAKLLLEARARLGDEQKDVAALESFSPTRIWAALRGTHVEDLDREKAEVRAAEYAVAELETRMQSLANDEASLSGQVAALAGAAARREEAVRATSAALIAEGGPRGEELGRLAAEIGSTTAEINEVSEAFEAATAAGRALMAASKMLAKASDWADVDTFLGGGMLTDSIKYDRMDQASRLLRTADAALARLSKEMGDLGRSGVAGPQVDGLTRTFDVWFDNLFSDWSVKSRIHDADERTRRAFHEVKVLRRSLSGRRGALTASLSALRARRDELLRG